MTSERRDEIAKRAYALWEEEGRPAGRDLDHWLRAEAELDAQWHVAPIPDIAPEEPKPPRAPKKRSTTGQRRKAKAST